MSTLRERRPGAARVAADAALTGLVMLVIALGVATGTAVAAGQTVRTGSTALGGDELRAPCSSTAIACVQLSTQHVWLVRDGRVVRDGFISTGATDTETPTGMFQVQWKSKNHVSGRYGTPMPYSVFFDGRGDALHEGSLAVQSRGCVHLTREDAKAFYDALRPGDPVQILP